MAVPRALVAGHLDVDRIETEAGVREELLGGGAVYAALAASVHAPPVGLIGTVCRDYPDERLEAAAEGRLELDLVRVLGDQRRNEIDYTAAEEGPSDRFSGGHHSPVWQEKCHTAGPRHVPTVGGAATEIVHLSPMLPRYARPYADWADENDLLLSLDSSEYYAETFPDAMRELVGLADVVLFSDTEATHTFPGFPEDPRGTVERMRDLGPEVVVVRRGTDGSLVADGDRVYDFDALETTAVDPTGAGDSFNGAFVARYPEEGVVEACKHGIATATRCVEAFGNEALLEASREDLEALAATVTYD